MALTYSDIEGLWIQAGGPASVAPIAAAITFPESGGNPGAIQSGQPYATTGWGLWQITPGNSVPKVGVDRALLDPLTNARAAVAKYNAAGNSFRPWTTFNNGAYQRYMQDGVTPNLNVAGAGGGNATQTSLGGDIANSVISALYPVINMSGNLVAFAALIISGGLLTAAGMYMLTDNDLTGLGAALGALKAIGGIATKVAE